MVAGEIVRFNGDKGYGFISPDDGGSDVFFHVRALVGEEADLRVGLKVQFDFRDDGKGPKATLVRISPSPVPLEQGEILAEVTSDDDYDVALESEFSAEVTDALVTLVPTATGAQVTQVRKRLIQYARSYGWLED